MIDSDRRPVSIRRPLLKSESTDIIISVFCGHGHTNKTTRATIPQLGQIHNCLYNIYFQTEKQTKSKTRSKTQREYKDMIGCPV
jgi:hypothetical protein